MIPSARTAALGAALLLCGAAWAEDEVEVAPTKEAHSLGGRMDYGHVLHYFLHNPADPAKADVVLKGISVDLGGGNAVCYDGETLRLAAGWSGGFVDMTATTPAKAGQGAGPATAKGKAVFGTRPGPGWGGKGGTLADPRANGVGNLPVHWAQYRGLYRHGEQTVLSYTIDDTAVRELPGCVAGANGPVFTRAIEVGKGAQELVLVVCEVAKAGGGVSAAAAAPGSAASGPAEGALAVLAQSLAGGDAVTAVGVKGAPKGATLLVADGKVLLRLPAQAAPARCTVAIWSGAKSALAAFAGQVKDLPATPDLAPLCLGGPAQATAAITTAGTLGTGDGAYLVDTLKLPAETPWNSWIRPTGLDFFADGRLAVCTFEGEVWVVSGIDATLGTLTWKRLASGLFEPLGLRVVDDTVYVLGRDQITKLVDLNGDGEADSYQCFFNADTIFKDYHDFSFDLQTDRAGNFYYVKGGNRVPHDLPLHSCVFKIAKDGASSEVLATGFRAPNGMGMGPNDEITTSDNQGHWTPACKINLVKKGGFYGYVAEPRVKENKDVNDHHPATFDPPLCWIPMPIDNSSGGEVWAPKEGWGPLGGQMLHMSYGKSTLFAVMHEEVGGVPQGGVVGFKLKFASGLMRGRFSPKDGQLYVCGIKGWQTNAGLDGCLQRVRYAGKPVCLPISLHVTANGVAIGFSSPLDKASVTADSFAIEEWNYHWTSTYGSDDYLVTNGQKKGHDKLDATKATLSSDGKTVTLEIPDLRPAMQVQIKYQLEDAGHQPAVNEIYSTINVMGK